MDRVTYCEESQADMDKRVPPLEAYSNDAQKKRTTMLLQLDDIKTRIRRNNIKLRGITESSTGADLMNTVKRILNMFRVKLPKTTFKLDHVHRMGPLRTPSDSPLDVLCRVHF